MADSLDNPNEVLFRQIHPSFIDDGVPTSQAFRPTPKDEGRLSVDRSALTAPEQSYLLYTASGNSSVAVYGVSVEEFAGEDIPCASDPIAQTDKSPANPAHAVADYSAHGLAKQKTVSKRLRNKAVQRGCLFGPVPGLPEAVSTGEAHKSSATEVPVAAVEG